MLAMMMSGLDCCNAGNYCTTTASPELSGCLDHWAKHPWTCRCVFATVILAASTLARPVQGLSQPYAPWGLMHAILNKDDIFKFSVARERRHLQILDSRLAITIISTTIFLMFKSRIVWISAHMSGMVPFQSILDQYPDHIGSEVGLNATGVCIGVTLYREWMMLSFVWRETLNKVLTVCQQLQRLLSSCFYTLMTTTN